MTSLTRTNRTRTRLTGSRLIRRVLAPAVFATMIFTGIAAGAGLQIGQPAPEFTAKDSKGR